MRQLCYELLAGLGQYAECGRIQAIGEGIGELIWSLVRSRRKMAIAAISERLDLNSEQATELARSSFRHNGRSFMEIFLSRKLDWRFAQQRLTVHDPERLQANLARMRGRPCVTTTAHLGAWELLPGFWHLLYPEQRGQVVVKATHDQILHRVIKRLRGHYYVRIIEHEQAASKVLRNLKQKRVSAFLVDHNCRREEAVFLPFLGRPAAVNIGPALLALRVKAVVWPVFLVRMEQGRYCFVSDDILDTERLTGSRQEKVQAVAEYYTRAVERMVRQYPEQWFWMHRRWKTRPEDESEGLTSRT